MNLLHCNHFRLQLASGSDKLASREDDTRGNNCFIAKTFQSVTYVELYLLLVVQLEDNLITHD